MPEDKYYTPKEAGQLLNITPMEVINLWTPNHPETNKFPNAFSKDRMLYIPQGDIDAYLQTLHNKDKVVCTSTKPTNEPKQDMDELLKQARGQAESIIKRADYEAQQIKDAYTKELQAVIDKAQVEAQLIKDEGDTYNKQRIAEVDKYYQNKAEQAERDYKAKIALANSEFEAKKLITLELLEAIKKETIQLADLHRKMQLVSDSYNDLLLSIQDKQNYYYNRAMSDYIGRFLYWAKNLIK